jgi:hypothetical protein
MKTVWKYTLTGPQKSFSIPKGARILTVQAQHSNPCLWMLVDTEAEEERRYFKAYGTGHKIDVGVHEGMYLGTVQLDGLVFHVFEVTEMARLAEGAQA